MGKFKMLFLMLFFVELNVAILEPWSVNQKHFMALLATQHLRKRVIKTYKYYLRIGVSYWIRRNIVVFTKL